MQLLYLLITSQAVLCVSALQCLRCDRVISPRHCHGKTTCDIHEVCYVDRFTGLDGETLYSVGCRSKEMCTSTTSMTRTHLHGEEKTCSTCCDGNLCNAAGCGAIGYPRERGPICYNCEQSINPSRCDKITVCGKDDMCHIEQQEEFGDIFYITKCLSKHLCNSDIGVIFGKRKKRSTRCSACCESDLCNSNCFNNMVTGYTQPYTHKYTTRHNYSTHGWNHRSTTSWKYSSTSPEFRLTTKLWYHHTTKVLNQQTSPIYATTTEIPATPTGHFGNEFFIMFMQNGSPSNESKTLELLITSHYTDYTVTIKSSYNHFKRVIAAVNGRAITTLPASLEDVSSNRASNKGIYISSTKPVFLVGISDYNCCSGEAFSVIPYHKLGTKYMLVSYPNGLRSFGIVSPDGSTFIKVENRSNGTNNLLLGAMQSAHFNINQDITGTIIESDKPIGVFSGNVESLIHTGNKNFETEMLIPVDEFEMRYIVPKIANVSRIILRIVPRDEYSTVYITGKNGFYKNTYKQYVNELDLPNDGYFINAQRPVMVSIYTTYEGPNLNPFMTLLPAIKQFSDNYIITTPTSNKYENYVTVIINQNDNEDGLRLNGGNLLFHALDITPITMFSDIFKSISVHLPNGEHMYKITHLNKTVKFGLLVYGYKYNAAYGYPGGFLL